MEEALELYVERTGSGPPVVLAHGFGGSARNFRQQGRALADRYTMIGYDARGHGRSPSPREASAYTTAELVGDLARVVETTAVPAVVGGLSLGAFTALAYALQAERAPRAVVVASYPAPESNPKRVRWALDFARAIDERGLDAAGAEFVWGEASRFDPSSAALIRQGFLEHAPHALSAMLRQVLAKIPTPDALRDALSKLTAPVLILSGSEDADALAAAEELSRSLPNAKSVTLRGAGHLVNLQATKEFNRELRAFLDGLPPP